MRFEAEGARAVRAPGKGLQKPAGFGAKSTRIRGDSSPSSAWNLVPFHRFDGGYFDGGTAPPI
jgi:hypothetical protein